MRDTTRTDLFLAALLSLFTHYAIVSVIPKAKPRREPGRLATVELELATPTADERAAPMPPIALPSAGPLAPEAEAVPTPEPPAPEQATAAPEVPAQPETPREHPQDLPDDFLQAVDLPNPNPDEPRPEDPHFLAQTNMDVEEETVARVRSRTGEAAELAPEPSGRSPGESEEPGDGEEEVVAEDADRPGEDVPAEAVAASSGTNQPPPIPTAGGSTAQEAVEAVAAVPDTSLGASGELAVSAEDGQEGTMGREGQAGAPGRPGRPNLKISWNQFREMYGDGELARQREEIAAKRRASSTRGHYRRNWERVRASMENYVPHVRTGNQTALRTAQSPFAAYLSHVHQKIHRYWADGFLLDLMALGDHNALNDPNLRTDLEIVIAPDGQVEEVGVVRTSGLVAFDAAAVDSAYRSGPHPSPPDAIKSGDGRVYFHWGFYRNARQCGTFNATPFILPDPPNLPRDSAEQPRPGGAQPPATEPQPDRGEPADPTHRELADDAAAG